MRTTADERRGSPPSSERALIERAKARDDAAWEELFRSYYDRLRTYLLYRVSRNAVAEELASQTFLEAITSIDRYQYRSAPFGAWLFRIARNLSGAYLRKEFGRRPPPLELPESPSPLGVLERELEARQIGAALQQLTDEQRQVVVLRFVSEMSLEETAKVMSKSTGAVKAMQHRALAALRRTLVAIDSAAWRDRSDA